VNRPKIQSPELHEIVNLFNREFEAIPRTIPLHITQLSETEMTKAIYDPMKRFALEVGMRAKSIDPNGRRMIVLCTQIGNLFVFERFANSPHVLALLGPAVMMESGVINNTNALTATDVACLFSTPFFRRTAQKRLVETHRKIEKQYAMPVHSTP
jgi:hypothetical protein